MYTSIHAYSPQCKLLLPNQGFQSDIFRGSRYDGLAMGGCSFLNLEYISNSSYEKAGATVDLTGRSFQFRWLLYHLAAVEHEIKIR